MTVRYLLLARQVFLSFLLKDSADEILCFPFFHLMILLYAPFLNYLIIKYITTPNVPKIRKKEKKAGKCAPIFIYLFIYFLQSKKSTLKGRKIIS